MNIAIFCPKEIGDSEEETLASNLECLGHKTCILPEYKPGFQAVINRMEFDCFQKSFAENLLQYEQENIPVINALGPSKWCTDRILLASVLERYKIPTPATKLLSEVEKQCQAPLLLKERYGDKTCLLEDRDRLKKAKNKFSEQNAPVVQSFFPAVQSWRTICTKNYEFYSFCKQENLEKKEWGESEYLKAPEKVSALARECIRCIGIDIAEVETLVDGRGNLCVVEVNPTFGYDTNDAEKSMMFAKVFVKLIQKKLVWKEASFQTNFKQTNL